MSEALPREDVVHLSSAKYLIGCVLAAIAVFITGKFHHLPSSLIAAEVFVTVIALFIFGSIRFRLDKNALTYGAILVIGATFWEPWWQMSALRSEFQAGGIGAIGEFASRHLLSLNGLEKLIHADTMLFILGLTFFVSVIAQTRLLESASFAVLRKTNGSVVFTVAVLAGIVSFASGILDGVSMIGLMIRTLVIILFLAKAKDESVAYAVVISTVVTTVCGMWLAYGEPPNLIMKANLHPHLTNRFFLTYCLPVAVGSYFIVLWNIRRNLKGQKVEIKSLDILDVHTADVRFMQAARHGKVLSSVEFIDDHTEELGTAFEPLKSRLHQGETLGAALVAEAIPQELRFKLLGEFTSENLAPALDQHYQVRNSPNGEAAKSEESIHEAIDQSRQQRLLAQKIGAIAFLPFIGFLVWHAADHSKPLFMASFAGFFVAFFGIARVRNMRQLAIKEAIHEYKEYLFLFPLFLSISLLQKTGFFSQLADLIQSGVVKLGASHMAFSQFGGATVLSAMLDNNVVADFAGRAIQKFDVGLLHLFAMAQMAGYALGGCWTHIGSAQSVVAYSFVRKEINNKFTPWQWIKLMTPIVFEIFAMMTVLIYGISWLSQR